MVCGIGRCWLGRLGLAWLGLGRLGIGKLLVGLGRLDFIREVMVGQVRVRLGTN